MDRVHFVSSDCALTPNFYYVQALPLEQVHMPTVHVHGDGKIKVTNIIRTTSHVMIHQQTCRRDPVLRLPSMRSSA